MASAGWKWPLSAAYPVPPRAKPAALSDGVWACSPEPVVSLLRGWGGGGCLDREDLWSNSGATVTPTWDGTAMSATASLKTSLPASETRCDPDPHTVCTDHERADVLLEEAEASEDRDREVLLRQEAVLLTLDLPERVARRYRGRGIDFDDLVQVGRLALVKAAQGYRTGCGHGFVAYAMPTISGEVKRHFRDCGWAVRPPRRLQEVRAELAVEEARLTQRLQRDPTMAELADTLGVESSEITRARECGAAYWTVSLDLPADHQGSQVELVAEESSDIERLLRRSSVCQALASLTDRERAIVHLRFVEERTQSEIGEVLGVSQMQVSRLLTSILARLRQGMTDGAFAA